MLDGLGQDLKFGVRSMWRARVTSLAAVLSLALGIGAATAMLGALDVWLVQPIPLPEPDRLVRVYMANRTTRRVATFSPRDLLHWRAEGRDIDLAAYARTGASLAADERVERIQLLVASANLLDVLGLEPLLGRGFVESDELAGAPPVTLLAHASWQESFGADPGVLGSTVVLDGEPHTVVGILPGSADFATFRADAWVPIEVRSDESGVRSLTGIARYAQGGSVSRAREELGRMAAAAERNRGTGYPDASVVPFRDAVYGPEYAQAGALVGSAVLFMLLIACANIANLLLARGARRSGELALRGALGAARPRICRQLLTESALLALFAAVVGLGFAQLGLEALTRYVLGPDTPAGDQLVVDARFLAIAVGLTALSTLVFGLLPAVSGSRIDVRRRLQQGSAGGLGGRRRAAGVFVVGQLALAVLLLVPTGLLTRSLAALRASDPGMRPAGLISFFVTAPEVAYPSDEQARAFHAALRERLAAIPGAAAVASSTHAPFGGYVSVGGYRVVGEGGTEGAEGERSAHLRRVSANWERVLGMRLLAGTWFGAEADFSGEQPVAVVTGALAARHWSTPGEALGERIERDEGAWTIIGVVADIGIQALGGEPQAILFRPIGRSESPIQSYVIGVRGDAAEVMGARRTLADLDPTVALYGVESVESQMHEVMQPLVATRRILATVGVIAIVLTLVGVYGVTAHTVTLRTREMGLRLAVGAEPGTILRLVLARTGWLAGWGLALGLVLSLATGRALSFVLVGVSPYDLVVLVTVAALVGVAAVAAAVEPALRAARVDPVEALRAR